MTCNESHGRAYPTEYHEDDTAALYCPDCGGRWPRLTEAEAGEVSPSSVPAGWVFPDWPDLEGEE